MTNTDQYLLRSVALSGGPEAWARDMCASRGVPSDPAAVRFARVWEAIVGCDCCRLQLGATLVAAIDAYDGPRVPVDDAALSRIVTAARAAGSKGGDA